MKNLLGGPDPSTREPLSLIWSGTSALTTSSASEIAVHTLSLVWIQIRRSPVSFILTLTSITVSLLLFSLFLLMAMNCREQVTQASEQISVSAYLKDGTTEDVAKNVSKEVEKIPGVKDVSYRSKEKALDYFTELVGKDSPLLVGLSDKNPLPASLEILLTIDAIQSGQYERIINNLAENLAVESVKVHNGNLSEASKAMESLRQSAVIGTIFMILVCGLLIANAIRLTVYANREELEIMQLVGASRVYMSTPFILEGVLQGFLGALLAVIFCRIIFPWLNSLYLSSPLGQLSTIGLSFLGIGSLLLVVVVGIATGFVASLLATRTVKYDAAG